MFILFYSSLSLLKAIAIELRKFFRFAVGTFLTEIFLWVVILGFAYIFASWGMSSNLSLFLAICSVFALIIVPLGLLIAVAFVSDFLSKPKKSKKSQVKLAVWLAETFADRESPEWEEYQDWLHDILLARRQLLQEQCPKGKVFVITYWRLSGFLVIISLTKMKNAAISVMKLR